MNRHILMTVRSHKAVVIGGAGFLGRRMIECMCGIAEPHRDWPQFTEILVFDIDELKVDEVLARACRDHNIKLSVQRGDICNIHEVANAVKGAHTVFHMASMVYVGLRRNQRIDAVNIDGTKNIIDACEQEGVPYLIYTSSEDVVLGKDPIQCGDESIPYPNVIIHDYVRTKIEGERLILAANHQTELSTCSIRPVHIYGPGDPHALIPSLRAFASGSVPFLLGNGSAKFDVVYVDNVVHAHLLAAKKLQQATPDDQVAGEAFFVNEGNAPNYFDWLRPYAKARGIKLPRMRLSFKAVAFLARAMELAHRLTGIDVPFHRFHLYVLCNDFYFSGQKAKEVLGYTPLVHPDEGLNRTLEWLIHADIDDL